MGKKLRFGDESCCGQIGAAIASNLSCDSFMYFPKVAANMSLYTMNINTTTHLLIDDTTVHHLFISHLSDIVVMALTTL